MTLKVVYVVTMIFAANPSTGVVLPANPSEMLLAQASPSSGLREQALAGRNAMVNRQAMARQPAPTAYWQNTSRPLYGPTSAGAARRYQQSHAPPPLITSTEVARGTVQREVWGRWW